MGTSLVSHNQQTYLDWSEQKLQLVQQSDPLFLQLFGVQSPRNAKLFLKYRHLTWPFKRKKKKLSVITFSSKNVLGAPLNVLYGCAIRV